MREEEDQGLERMSVDQDYQYEENRNVSNLFGEGTCFSSNSLYLVRFIEGKMEVIQSCNEERDEGLIVEPLKTVWVEKAERNGNKEEENKEKEWDFGF